jgi:LEA14-like dessication related protein
MNKLSLANPNLSVELFYFNPNNYRLKIKRAEGNAWINGQPLGHFTVDSMVHISALTDFRLPVNLQVDKNHLTENVSTLVLAQEVTLKIEAMAKIGKGLVFINYPIHYEGKQNLREILK